MDTPRLRILSCRVRSAIRHVQPSPRGLVVVLSMLLLGSCADTSYGTSSGAPRCDRNGDQEQRKAC
jgi:hypothetical protein